MRNNLTLVEGFSYYCTEKKSLQVEDNLVNHLFEVNHFVYRCLKFKKEMKAVIAPYKEGV